MTMPIHSDEVHSDEEITLAAPTRKNIYPSFPTRVAKSTSKAERNPKKAARLIKISLITVGVLATLVGAGLLTMHFSGLSVNKAGLKQLWSLMLTKHQFTTGQVLLYGVIPPIALSALGLITVKIISSCVQHNKASPLSRSHHRVKMDEDTKPTRFTLETQDLESDEEYNFSEEPLHSKTDNKRGVTEYFNEKGELVSTDIRIRSSREE